MTYEVIAQGLQFPEGPVVLPDGTLYVGEMRTGTVTRIAADSTMRVVASCGGGVNGLALGPDNALYACNNGGSNWGPKRDSPVPVPGLAPDYIGGRIQRIDLRTFEVTDLYTSCDGIALSAPNDLVFDREGGFYFTDHGKVRGRLRDIGSVYYARIDGGNISEVIHPIGAPNGIALSPDQRTLYVAETETSRLYAYPVQVPGRLHMLPYPSPNGGRLVCGLPGYQRFDSMAVQANGDICIATLVSGCVTVISPDGDVRRVVDFGDPYTTNLCFGGPGLKTAYVTLSVRGHLVRMDWPEPGLPLNF